MNTEDLETLQAPLEARNHAQPEAATVTRHAEGRLLAPSRSVGTTA